jgi:hypothetical protein
MAFERIDTGREEVEGDRRDPPLGSIGPVSFIGLEPGLVPGLGMNYPLPDVTLTDCGNGRADECSSKFGEWLAHRARNIAHRNRQHFSSHGYGECSKVPRLLLAELGLRLPPMPGVKQGLALLKTGLFKEVPANEARPGDYCFADWNESVQQEKGRNLGHSCIVTRVEDGKIYEVDGACGTQHALNLKRYVNIRILRPTQEFADARPPIG